MWTRLELKTRAKAILRLSYWKAFLVSLIIGIVSGEGIGGLNFHWNMGGSGNRGRGGVPFHDVSLLRWLPIIITFFGIILLLAFAFRIFLGYPLEVGGRRYFVKSAQTTFDLNNIGFSFQKGIYFNIIKAMLWRDLFNFLWFLLLIIPGIVKYYAYAMVPYILADNPGIGYRRALELSKRMTKGHKAKMWILDLSFIGWYLLGALALLVGVLFVRPYDFATKAELYMVLRRNALETGMCRYEELGLTAPEQGM